MAENEHLIRRTNSEVFGQEPAESLSRIGTIGLIPLEISIEDLAVISARKELNVLPVVPNPIDGVGQFVINRELVITTIASERGVTLWVFNDDFEKFKRIFI